MKHNVTKGSVTVGYDGASNLRVYQDPHKSHPIYKANSNLRKGITRSRNKMMEDHVVYIRFEDIADQQNN